VRLTNLGEVYAERIGIPEDNDASDDSSERVDRITELKINASVRHITTGQDGQQTVFVYVTDQQHQPVPEAVVVVTVHYESGDYKSGDDGDPCAPTDNEGFTEYVFDLLPAPPGENLVIDVAAKIGDVAGQTQTFFLPWW
jgi:hypothetical protein